jgi:hypothetical protein
VQAEPEASRNHERVFSRACARIDASLDGCDHLLERGGARRSLESDSELAGGARLEQQRVVSRPVEAKVAVGQAARSEFFHRAICSRLSSVACSAQFIEAPRDNGLHELSFVGEVQIHGLGDDAHLAGDGA